MLQENIHTFFKPLYLITLAESLGGVESLVCHPASMTHASMQYSISVENQPYPVLCTLSADGCTAHVPDFPKVTAQAPTLDAALLEVKQQIEKVLRQYKNPPIPTKQDQIVVPTNSVLVLVKAG